MVERALALGLRAFDTANLYGDGVAERWLGAALAGVDADVTTKVGAWRKEGLSSARVVASLDESLSRLGRDSVARYLLHQPDPATPLDQTLDGVEAVLATGKAQRWGVSNFAAWQLVELVHRCRARGLPPPAESQVLYNLAVRQLEIEYFACARALGVETAIYNPLAGGLLAGDPQAPAQTSRLESNAFYRRRYGAPPLRAFATRCAAIASAHGRSLAALALSWVVHRPGVDAVVLGPATVEQLEELVVAASVRLEPAATRALDEAWLGLVGTDVSYAR